MKIFKGIDHTQNKILSLFTHPYSPIVSPDFIQWNIKGLFYSLQVNEDWGCQALKKIIKN